MIEQDDPLCIDNAHAKILLRDSPWRRFAILGDSNAEGCGDSVSGYADGGWPIRVVQWLRSVSPSLEYLNTAVQGATSAEVVERQLPKVLEFRPDLAYPVCGSNDLWVERPDFGRMNANLHHVASELATSGAQIIMSTMADNFEAERMQPLRERVIEFNRIVEQTARDVDAILIDLWLHPVRLRDRVLSKDLMHYSMMGQAAIAATVAETLSAAISSGRGHR